MPERARYSDIDSRRFEKRIYRAEVLSPGDVEALDAVALEESVDMVITRCPAAEIRTVHALEARGHRLMDTLVGYSGRTLFFDGKSPSHSVRRATLEDREGLGAVAAAAFAGYDGHYHADPRLDPALATLGYVDWCLSSLDSKDGTMWVVTEEGECAAFLAMKPEGAVGRITLNGVAPRYQRRGIYDSLVKVAGRALFDDGTQELVVSTHVNNLGPQKVWVNNGLTISSVAHTFHKWFTP